MKEALKEAQKAFDRDEVPVGAIVVSGDRIISRGFNQTIMLNDNSAHAEMIAITSAFNAMNSRILDECSIYVTIEPCLMCAGAIFWARPATLVYGASEPKHGYTKVKGQVLHPATVVRSGIAAEECAGLMKEFFARKRKL
jgi:tRNA(adenine34) deaminase